MEKRKCIAAGLLIVIVTFLGMASGHEAFAQGGLTKIAENVYSYVDVKKSGPQNSYGANAGVVIGRDGLLVIDTLISSKEARRFIEDIRKISDKPVKYVVNTHYHLDHSFGNSEFSKLGATIISHEADKENALKHNELTLKNAEQFGLTAKDMEGTTIAYPGVTFNDRMEVDLGDQKVELIYPKPSHTGGSILVYLPDKKVLFTGDVLFTDFHPFMVEGDIKSWTRVLDFIVKLDVVTIIPGHGPISGKKDVRDMKHYLIRFDKKARQLCAKSRDVEFVASQIKKALPARSEGDWIVGANIKMRYLMK